MPRIAKVKGTINRYMVQRMISLLDWCYRLGVKHAYHVNDDGLALEFIENHREIGVYGFMTDSYNIGVVEWQLRLLCEARRCSLYGVMYSYFEYMGRYGANFLSCFIPVAQEWYNMGVEDYTAAPSACMIDEFDDASRVRWSSDGLLKIKPEDYVQTIQLQCFGMKRRHDEFLQTYGCTSANKHKALVPKRWDMFIRALSIAVRPVVEW